MTTTTLHTALALMRRKALARYPDEADRITRGFLIAQAGGVELLEDGIAMVQSQTFQDTRYAVTKGLCICNDQRFHPETFCKHRFARQLWINARRLVSAQTTAEHTTRAGTHYAIHTEHPNVIILLGKKGMGTAQRMTEDAGGRKATGDA